MFGFSIYQMDLEEFSLQRRIYAREAFYKDERWHLRNGWQRTFAGTKVKYDTFKQLQIHLPVNPEFFTTEQQLPSEMNFAELKSYISKMKLRGYDFVRFAVDLQAKISFPAVSLILTLI